MYLEVFQRKENELEQRAIRGSDDAQDQTELREFRGVALIFGDDAHNDGTGGRKEGEPCKEGQERSHDTKDETRDSKSHSGFIRSGRSRRLAVHTATV